MRKIRTMLSLPVVVLFYASMYVSGLLACIANIIAGHDGIIKFSAEDLSTGEVIVDVDG